MNYSTTNSSGTSSVAPGVEHFLLFPAPHGGGFVAFCALLKLIPTFIPGWGGSGFTLTGALVELKDLYIKEQSVILLGNKKAQFCQYY